MADAFDPYREALVMETNTVWPEAYDELEPAEKERLETALHGSAEKSSQLEYVRTHAGFCRQITVTEADLARVRK